MSGQIDDLEMSAERIRKNLPSMSREELESHYIAAMLNWRVSLKANAKLRRELSDARRKVEDLERQIKIDRALPGEY